MCISCVSGGGSSSRRHVDHGWNDWWWFRGFLGLRVDPRRDLVFLVAARIAVIHAARHEWRSRSFLFGGGSGSSSTGFGVLGCAGAATGFDIDFVVVRFWRGLFNA